MNNTIKKEEIKSPEDDIDDDEVIFGVYPMKCQAITDLFELYSKLFDRIETLENLLTEYNLKINLLSSRIGESIVSHNNNVTPRSKSRKCF